MNVLSAQARAAIIRGLIDGRSVRSTARLTGAAKATVLRALVEVGEFCSTYQDQVLTNLPCTRIETAEIWTFAGSKSRNAGRDGGNSVWTFTAIDADSKLVVSWQVGIRSVENAHEFVSDVTSRLADQSAVATDGHGGRLTPIDDAVESSTNGLARTHRRRVTRIPSGLLRRTENHAHAISLFFFFYNFCRTNIALTEAGGGVQTTPAMAAGLTARPWLIDDLLATMDKIRLAKPA